MTQECTAVIAELERQSRTLGRLAYQELLEDVEHECSSKLVVFVDGAEEELIDG